MSPIDGDREARGGVSRIRRRLTYANVLSTLAVFGVLAGGGAYAASKIGSAQIKPNAVKSKHIARNAVKGKQVAEAKLQATPLRTRVAQGDCHPAVPGTGQMVRVGSVCVDRYENSLWTRPDGGEQITGAIPCRPNGQDCTDIYARSVPGVTPRVNITWFQAQQALANSGKRLPTSAEWQMAVRGTPDDTGPSTSPCNTRSGSVQSTGASAGCASDHGANDMAGNVWEWVADWLPRSTCDGEWPAAYGDDQQRICGAAESGAPAALRRGGHWNSGANAGPFAVDPSNPPSFQSSLIGFRGAR